jgi:hypothetical protein
MANVTLRDLSTNEDLLVPPEGLVFGRAGGGADVELDDLSLARKHARVSNRGGAWLLEVASQPGQPAKLLELSEGRTFQVGSAEFEVVSIGDDVSNATIQDLAGQPPPRRPGGNPPPGRPPQRPPPANAMRTTPSAPAQRRPPPPRSTGGDGDDDGGGDDEPEQDELGDEGDEGGEAEAGGASGEGFPSLLISVPKAIGYYLLAVPKMLFNPMGTVRTAIEEQPAEAMGKWALMGYALPSLLATALLGSIAGGIATLIAGGGFSIMAFIPIPQAVGALIGAIVTGFIFHPVTEWIVTKLQGTSDDKSRTNYFLNLMTVAIIVAVPNALGTILASVRIPFINLVGPLIMTAASLVTIFVLYKWFVAFEVVDWFRKVILGLGALAVLFAAYGLVMGIINNVRALGSGGGGSAEVVADAPELQDADEAIAKAKAAADKAIADAKKRGGAAVADAKDRADEAADAKAPADKPKDPPPPPPEAKKPDEAPVAVAEPPKADPEPVKKPPEPPKATGKAGSAYGDFARKREAMERMLEADPTVLDGDRALQDLYGDYLKESYDLDKKYAKDIAKNPGKVKLYEHLKNSELFRKTHTQVDQLAGKLGVR